MAPPVTPSPHRFTVKKLDIHKSSFSRTEHGVVPAGSQFKATPRFSFAHSQSTNVPDPPLPPSVSRYITPCAQGSRLQEAVEDTSDTVNLPDIDARKCVENLGPAGSIEDFYGDEEDNNEFIKPRTPKRRRLSSHLILNSQSDIISERFDDDRDNEDAYAPGDMAASPSRAISSPPTALFSRHTGSTTMPRFVLPTTASPAPTPMPTRAAAFAKPPRFRAAEEQELRPPEPLPEMFSPHRRGHKFLAGGLAAEVVGWLVRVENSVPSQISNGPGGWQWAVRLVVDEIRGGSNAGMTLVRGRRVDTGMESQDEVNATEAMKVILAGQEKGIGLEQHNQLRVGAMVEIKRPTWEVAIGGEKWGVGVDWKTC